MDRLFDRLLMVAVIVGCGLFVVRLAIRHSGNAGADAESAPPGMVLQVTREMPRKGSPSALVAIVEFSEYECPFCRRHATSTAIEIDREYVESGEVRYFFGNFPLPIHSRAKELATLALCAGEQSRYWDAHDLLFRNVQHPADIATRLSLDATSLELCVSEDRFSSLIQRDIDTGNSLGVRATPTFLLGFIDRQDEISVKTIIRGAEPFSVFQAALDELLQ